MSLKFSPDLIGRLVVSDLTNLIYLVVGIEEGWIVLKLLSKDFIDKIIFVIFAV